MRYSTTVEAGHGRGKQIGFPTYNVIIPAELTEKHGIYAAWVWIGEVRHQAAAHYGPVPTFNKKTPTLEFFLLDYDQHVELATLSFELVHYIRPIEHFSDIAALQERIAEDVRLAKEILGTL